MHRYAVLLSIPGLRKLDLEKMPRLAALGAEGAVRSVTPSFPCVTCTVQAAMTTGVGVDRHGVIANGFYWRDKAEVEMWTAWNEVIQSPQIWERLQQHDSALTSAVWFPLHSKGAKADFICTPAPIHNPDGSESLWCYTRPTELYGELRDALGHFPLMNFWGPMANIKSTAWIVDSAVHAAKKFQPRFSYIYLPHLDYAAQKHGPDSPQAIAALGDLDAVIGKLVDGYSAAGLKDVLWVAASEYAISPVTGVHFPNRVLRDAGMLALSDDEGRELLDCGQSRAFAMVDHQVAHVFVKDEGDVETVAGLFRGDLRIAEVLTGSARGKYGLDQLRSGEVILVAKSDQWFAYYWWNDDAKAPKFARTVDIHQKPGYDPVELFVDLPTRSIPLDGTLVRGSHGSPANSAGAEAVLLASDAEAFVGSMERLQDTDVAAIILRNFGVV